MWGNPGERVGGRMRMTPRTRKAPRQRREAFAVISRRRPTFPPSCPGSIIGAGGLNFRVRDGNGCFPSAIATGNQENPGTACDVSRGDTTDDHQFPHPGELFLPEDLPGHKIIQLTVRPVSHDPFGDFSGDPGEPPEFFQPRPIQIHLGLDGTLGWPLLGNVLDDRDGRIRVPGGKLCGRQPGDPRQDQDATGADQDESASHKR